MALHIFVLLGLELYELTSSEIFDINFNQLSGLVPVFESSTLYIFLKPGKPPIFRRRRH